jgi:hypothetical protein
LGFATLGGGVRKTHIAEINLVVGTPEPKTVPVFHGGPVVVFQLRDSQQIQLAVEALDAEGNPAAATTTWTSSDDVVASVSADGLVVASPGAGGLGTATITASVTDTSDGDVHEGTFEVEVVAGDVVIVNITAGAAEDKPVA